MFGISSLGWFLVRWRWKIFALLSSPTAVSWRRWHRRRRLVGALLFQPANANQVHCQFELNRWPSTAAPGSKSHPACHSPKSKRWSTEHHRSPNLDGKKCWQIQLNGNNQPNHRSEPAEPLDSPHESPISKRKICSRRRPSTRTFVWIFANMRHFSRTSSPGLYENCNFRFAKRPFCKRNSYANFRETGFEATRK